MPFKASEASQRIATLERRLLAYENAHTPPSKQQFKKKRLKSKSGKIGAKKGHPKWERKNPEPTVTVEYTEKSCPYCNSELGLSIEIKEFIEEEIPEP